MFISEISCKSSDICSIPCHYPALTICNSTSRTSYVITWVVVAVVVIAAVVVVDECDLL